MSTTNKTRAAFGAVLVLLAIAGALSWLGNRNLARARDWIAHTQEVERDLEALATALNELESGMRGFALTGDRAQLHPALRAEQTLPLRLASLQAFVQDNERQRAEVERIQALVQEKLRFTREVIDARRVQGLEAARQLVLSGRGLQLMDRIRGSLDRLRATERALLQSRSDTAEGLRHRNARLYSLLAVLFALALLTWAWLLREEVRARRAAREAIRKSEQRLRLMLSAVRDYAILILSPEGRVETWNPAAERMYGYTEREALGEHLSIFYPPEDAAAGKPQRELQAAEVRGWFEEEGLRVRKGGEAFWADARLTAMRDDEASCAASRRS